MNGRLVCKKTGSGLCTFVQGSQGAGSGLEEQLEATSMLLAHKD